MRIFTRASQGSCEMCKVFSGFTAKNLALEQRKTALKALACKGFRVVQYALCTEEAEMHVILVSAVPVDAPTEAVFFKCSHNVAVRGD